jgi:hypothetical protein
MAIPKTTVRTSHAVAIRANGVTIGQIQTWNPQQTRGVVPTYELNSATTGEVYENVPGNISGLTIQVSRYDLYKKKMEQAWGTSFNIQMLTDQANPLEISEKWSNPDGSVELYVYTGCWFTNLGRSLTANGDRIVNVSASLMYERVRAFL